MRKVWNFSAGPAQLPLVVLEQAQEELLSYQDSGISVMEMSHRSQVFQEIMAETQVRIRRLLNIPENYALLFLQGGASLQFAMLAMNLKQKGKAAYIHTGNWSKKAIEEAERVGMTVDIVASSEASEFTVIPEYPLNFEGYDYVHITTNNTIEGTVFTDFPDTGKVPLVADMSSIILAEPLDVKQFGLIYAGAQKNLGIAGLTLVIIRKDLLGLNENLPKILDYKIHFSKNSNYNTPPTYAIYLSNLIFKWLENLGGLEVMAELNQKKAAALYHYLDHSALFHSPVPQKHRSLMNIPFTSGNSTIDSEFIEFSYTQGLINLKGHRLVGGMRASLYNAMPLKGVEALIQNLQEFEKEKGGK